jgi:hypothetical protein
MIILKKHVLLIVDIVVVIIKQVLVLLSGIQELIVLVDGISYLDGIDLVMHYMKMKVFIDMYIVLVIVKTHAGGVDVLEMYI